MVLDALVNRPNTIVAQQKAFQADPRPVYLKTKRAGLYMTLFMGVFTVGLVGVTHGVYKMAIGDKGDKKK